MPPALFSPVSGGAEVVASELTRGPWAHRVMHGGPICGLLGWLVETTLGRPDLVCSRLTVDILSGVPVEMLAVEGEVLKEGKRTALVDGRMLYDGRVVARATSQWLSPTAADGQPGAAVLPSRPELRQDPAAHPDMEYPRPGFNADAVDLRAIQGSTEDPGAGVMWMRLDHDLIEGQPTSLFQQLATLSDLGAAVGWEPSLSDTPLINTDVTLQLTRRPGGEWLLFESGITHGVGGVSVCRTTISDEFGLLGWVMQSQLEAPPEISF